MSTPTVGFDHHSPAWANNSEAVIAELRAAGPLVYSPHHGGFWVTTSFAVARSILSDPVTFSSQKRDDGSGGVTIPSMGPRLIPGECDAPFHTDLRRVLKPVFSKQGLGSLRTDVERIVDRTLDRAIEMGEFDLADDLAWVIAPMAVVDWLGLPGESRKGFIAAVRDGLSTEAIAGNPDAAVAAFSEVAGIINALIAERRTNPQDDLTSFLAHHEDPSFDDDELLWLIFTLLLGGIENTAALMTNALLHLAENPELRRRLQQDPSLIPAATEEFLRYYTPGVTTARNVTKDTEVAGQLLRSGERVLVLLPAANHDPAAFERPEEFDIDRKSNPHLAFGAGAHYCVGVWLARMEFHYLLQQILLRIPDFTVDRSRGIRYDDAGTMNGWSYLPATTNL